MLIEGLNREADNLSMFPDPLVFFFFFPLMFSFSFMFKYVEADRSFGTMLHC